jgi:RNA polymerase sigma-70 factor, ECF subfamily
MQDRDVIDLSLIQRIADGNREAFREMLDSRGPALLGFLVRIVRDRDCAEEILEDVFLQVWCLSRSYRPETASPFAWMLRLARSRAIEHLRLHSEAIAALEHLEQRFRLFSAA